MALQVWLPLNKDYSNVGVDGHLSASTLGTVSIANDGPIGGCLVAGTAAQTANGLSLGSNMVSELGRHFSCAVWVKPNGNHVHYNGTIISSGNWNTTNGRWAFGVSQDNTKVDVFGPNYNQWVTCSVPVGVWTHLVSVFDDGVGTLYKNGEFVGTYNFGTAVFSSDTTTFTVGRETYASGYFSFNGRISDLRIYNHCLSAKEAKEISKGLVQHFKLNYLSINNQNSIIIEPDGSKWAHVVHHNNPGGGVFAQTDDFVGGVYKDANRWFKLYEVVNKLSTFEFMVKQKTTSSASEVKYRWIQNVSPIGATYEQVAPAQVTRITTNGYTNGNFGGLYVTNTNAHLCIANTTKGNWFGAFGSWTVYQNGTPGYPNTVVTTGYMDLYVRVYDDIVISDCSGYGNDGTVYGMPTLQYNTARYDAAVVTSTNNCIIAGRGGMIKDAITVSVWASMNSWGIYNGRLASCTEGGGWNFEPNGGKMGFAMGTGVSSNTYKNAVSTKTLANLSNGWHHFVGTYDGLATKIYIDGVLEGTNNAYTTRTPIFYANNAVFIGAEAAATQTTPGGNYFAGALSDFRIYGTALSAEDIAELYHTGASIDNKGNFFCGEIKEE